MCIKLGVSEDGCQRRCGEPSRHVSCKWQSIHPLEETLGGVDGDLSFMT